MTIHPSEIEERLKLLDEIDRRKAKDSFLAFYMRMTGFLPPDHLRLVAKLLQSMEEDKVDRAMIFAPPRHAKTLTATILFPAWLMGRHPTTALMSVVHTQDYAGKVGRKVRNLLRSTAWPFDEVGLSDDSQAREHWTTPHGGEYNGFGATAGNQHGNPAEWLFMDDLVKGRKIAMSAHMRDEVWENYTTDMLSRLQGRAKQLMTFTRWHQDDPAGRILPEDFDGRTGWYKDRNTGEKWFVLCLPAVCERDDDPLGRAKGDWLWPDRFGEDKLGGMQKRGGWRWSALYQQRPSPEEGLLFTKDHIGWYNPGTLDRTRLQIYGSSDYAVTAEAGAHDPDYTVHLVWGVDDDWNLYLLDGWRGRTESDAWVSEFCRLVRLWKPLRWFEEQGQIIKGIGPFLRRQMALEHAYVDRVQLTSSTSKEQRAQSLLGMAAMGKMLLPMRAGLSKDMILLVDAIESELLQFPTGKHDDTVDAATLFGRGLDRIIEGVAPKRGQAKPGGETLDDLFERHDAELRRRED
jgi:predicted phage terminase large subunit-like protein